MHNDVDTLVFTGSTKIAKQLLIYSGESNMKRVWLEAGGKSPNIVFADAPDLHAAAQAAASAIAFNQGEVCTAGSRLLVERSIKDTFLPLVIEALKEWKPGNPLDPSTTVGALVDTQQMNTVLSYIQLCWPQGSCLVTGGKGDEQWFDGLPWYLTDLRPQGFLRRAWGRKLAAQLPCGQHNRMSANLCAFPVSSTRQTGIRSIPR